MKLFRYHISSLLFMALFFVPLIAWGERKVLIESADQLSSNVDSEDGTSLANLLNNDPSSIWISNHTQAQTKYQHIQIEFKDVVVLDPTKEDIVVRLLRHDGSHNLGNTKHPTTFRVLISEDGENWVPFQDPDTHLYFLSRGLNTMEYSTRITTSKKFQYMRLVLTANNSRTTVGDSYISDSDLSQDATTAVRCMAIGGLQIIKLGRNDNYSDKLVDRFRLITDYSEAYKNYAFENTNGLICEKNIMNENGGWYSGSNFTADGKWNKDNDLLDKYNIHMPDFSFITSEEDHDLVSGQKRQRTHVTEHILYAMPGDAIALYPYYDLATTGLYEENFSHWYDYKTGGRLQNAAGADLLDFLIDPAQVNRTDNFGFVAGKDLPLNVYSRSEVVKIGTAEEFVAFAKRVNEGNFLLSAKLTADIDFTGVEFVPIGSETMKYRGFFDGDNHKLSNITINLSSENNVGIFRAIRNAVIRNLVIDESCHITGSNNVGVIGTCYLDESQTDVAGNSYIEGIVNNGHVTGNINVSGILGKINVYSAWGSHVHIRNCGVTGTVTGKEKSSAIIGNGDNTTGHTITNCWNTAEIFGFWCEKDLDGKKIGCWRDNKTELSAYTRFWTMYHGDHDGRGNSAKSSVKCDNSYDKYQGVVCKDNNNLYTLEAPAADVNEFVKLLGTDDWEVVGDVLRPKVLKKNYNRPTADVIGAIKSKREYGTVATFFYPRDPYREGGQLYELPEEYVIAADFGQHFNPDTNINTEEHKIIEPTVSFRHIFRIRDGHAFAEEFSGSEANNLAYVNKHQRYVAARAGKEFQIRLDSPIPVESTTRSKYYYKISPTDYRRVTTCTIEVYNADNGQEIKDHGFKFADKDSETFAGQGSRKIDDVEYFICGGGGKYYRMLSCPAEMAKEGRYIVKLIGKGYGGIDISPYKSKAPLIVQQFVITFLPERTAFMASEEQLLNDDKYSKGLDVNMEEVYGKPHVAINFDEYRHLVKEEKKDNEYVKYYNGQMNNAQQDAYGLKWPVKWSSSNYAFGYSKFHDYNMYYVIDNSLVTRFSGATAQITGEKNFGKGNGLYDRLFYDTKGEDRGFFYFVNAASDPGVMSVLPVEGLCAGSALHVTAWVAECSNSSEVANLAFNLVARMNEKRDESGRVIYSQNERVLLHTFVSGYVEQVGTWMKVYYSFIPNFAEFGINPDEVNRYEIELDNNCKSSNGADYGIDDIKVYIAKPLSYATQKNPICREEIETDVKVESSFSAILQALGLEMATSPTAAMNVNLFYTFLDKEVYDREINAGKEKREAVEASRLKFKYEPNNVNEEQTYGQLSFSTHYLSNEEYTGNQLNTAFRQDVDGEQMIVFDTRPSDSKGLKPGREYIVVFCYRTDADLAGKPFDDIADFDLDGKCARTCAFVVKGASMVKVDGVLVPDLGAVSACENNSPVVQISIYGKNTSNGDKLEEYSRNAILDWYAGSLTEFNDVIGLHNALLEFRKEYPDATTADVEPKGDFTTDMRDLLVELSTPTEDSPEVKLVLHRSSYVFPPLSNDDGDTQAYRYVVAIPNDIKAEGWLLCTDPIEVKVAVVDRAPELTHGFQIVYPEHISDVPLRIGLTQLASVSFGEDEVDTADGKVLYIPVRSIGGSIDLKPREDVEVLLVETNDPEYGDLHLPQEPDGTGLMSVGWLRALTAQVGGANNLFKVSFNKDFKFKESYYYRMRFQFEETTEAEGDELSTCSGQHVFTIKIVPEYQKWTGAAGNNNWNNDGNWARVSSSELYRDENVADDFTVDGANSVTSAYAPLDFTKVIIPAGASVPHLYEKGRKMEDVIASDGHETTTYSWPSDPESAADASAKEVTEDIQYDMAAFSYDNGVGCRPWYLHTCDQINFRPASEIMNQQWLNYDKAWVEMEIDHSRWYTLASPLKGVVAGDMYLPAAGNEPGRQTTELFQDIHYAQGRNDRFRPAVYQRSWNKASAMVYEMNGPSRDVAVRTTWSNVFNDVLETYANDGGIGFSIKADVSEIAGARPEKVLFRFPKADVEYDYYSKDGQVIGNNTKITRPADYYKLNDTHDTITVTAAADSRYFLVGNPFMAHLDMKKFLEANSGKVTMKYWILSADTNEATVIAGDGSVVGTSGAPATVAPLQGFFVEAQAAGKELQLAYDESMMCVPADNGVLLRSASRAAAVPGGLIVSAVSGGRVGSKALLQVAAEASQGYDEAEDAVLLADRELLDAPLVYTLAGNVAASVNRVATPEKVEIGVMAEAGEEVALRFDGAGRLADYQLFDALTGEYIPLEEGMVYPVKGPVSGRLFITSGMADDALAGIKVTVSGRQVTVTTGRDALAVDVYDLAGRKIKSVENGSHKVSFSLDAGAFIVEAVDGEETKSEKIIVK